MAFPTKQFNPAENNQKPEDMKNNMNLHFEVFNEIKVNTDEAHPLYKYLRRNSSLYIEKSDKCKPIPWNFAKFLVDREGSVIHYYRPNHSIAKIEADFIDLLD